MNPKKRKKGKLIGSGSYGSVYEYGPHQVIKISNFRNEFTKQDTFCREVYFLRFLQSTGLVPLLKSSFQQGSRGIQVMERFDGCMKELSSAFAQHHNLKPKSLLFTVKQFKAICSIAKKLDQMGIHHGDFKLRNLLYQKEGHHIVVADFGFAGCTSTPYSPLIGFVRHYGCAASKKQKGESFELVTPIPDSVLPFANRMHLYMYFVRSKDRFFVLGDNAKIAHLTGTDLLTFLSLTSDQEKEIYTYCPTLLVPQKGKRKGQVPPL